MMSEQKQAQAARCPCKGTDDYCPCQNVPDRQAPRFFIDHGVIHDRVTGKHVVTDGQPPFEDSLEQVLDLLNGLAPQTPSSNVANAGNLPHVKNTVAARPQCPVGASQ